MHKSSWSAIQIQEAEQLLKSLPPRKVAEIIGRTSKQITNKFYNPKATRPGASLAEKAGRDTIPCMQCLKNFVTWCKIKNRRCRYCKSKEDGIAYGGHSLNLGASDTV